MTDEAGLLAAIRDDPESDDLRRIYADWLDDNGQPGRAEFIRVQLELAAMPHGWPNEHNPRRHALDLRQTELLWEFRDRWLDGLPDVEGVEYLFQRGLPSWVKFANQDVFRRVARRVFRSAIVERISVGRESAAQVMLSPLLAGITHLDLPANALHDQDLEALADSSHFFRLRWLNLSHNRLGPIGVRALAQSPLLAGLRFLDLTGNYGSERAIGDEGARALAEPRQVQSLKTLLLGAQRIGTDGAFALGSAAALAGLEVLNLSYNPLGDAVEALAGSPFLRRLRWLSLRSTRPGPRGLAALADSPLLSSLVVLDLSMNPLGDSVEALARSPRLTRLESLDLSACALSTGVAIALASNPALASLRYLNLGGNCIAEAGARALATSPHLGNLELLHLDEARNWLKQRLGNRVRL